MGDIFGVGIVHHYSQRSHDAVQTEADREALIPAEGDILPTGSGNDMNSSPDLHSRKLDTIDMEGLSTSSKPSTTSDDHVTKEATYL